MFLPEVKVNFTLYVPVERGWASKLEVRGSELTELPIPYTMEEDGEGGCNVTCSGDFAEGELLEVAYKNSLNVIHRTVGVVKDAAKGGWEEIGSFAHTKDMFSLLEKLDAEIGRRE
jgi:hypothetical protein